MPEYYDVLIKDAKIIDGTGKAAFKGSVGIKGQKIAAVGTVEAGAARVIDGSGLVVCPGFVDTHSHADREILRCKRAEYVGKTIGDLARERQPHDIIRAVYEESFEVVFDILAEDADTTCADIVDKREHGVLSVFLEHPAGTPCTDTGVLPAEPAPADYAFEAAVSPTAYGLYPHYIRVFVKEKGTLGLEEAVRKATSVPAQEVLGLADRGVIAEGAYADMILFDLERLAEGGDYLHPARPPEGIEYVLVNGTVVCEKNAHTGERPGKVLRHTA